MKIHFEALADKPGVIVVKRQARRQNVKERRQKRLVSVCIPEN